METNKIVPIAVAMGFFCSMSLARGDSPTFGVHIVDDATGEVIECDASGGADKGAHAEISGWDGLIAPNLTPDRYDFQGIRKMAYVCTTLVCRVGPQVPRCQACGGELSTNIVPCATPKDSADAAAAAAAGAVSAPTAPQAGG